MQILARRTSTGRNAIEPPATGQGRMWTADRAGGARSRGVYALAVDVGVRQREIAGTLRVCAGDLHASGKGLSCVIDHGLPLFQQFTSSMMRLPAPATQFPPCRGDRRIEV